jgi:tetratricopeptide (TPR) repeat protein
MMTDLAGHCLHLIALGVKQLQQDNPQEAGRLFAWVLTATRAMPPENGCWELRALALYNLSRLQARERRTEEARKLREQATEFLSNNLALGQLPPFQEMPLFQELMADVLTELREYRRAIPYCEASIQNFTELLDSPPSIAGVVWRAGKCYAMIGLRDHAAVPLRAAVKYFRMLAGDPRLPAVLLDLGSALGKSSPGEAEQCYREAAELYVSRFQLESASAAWVNLGVLCSRQERYPESLEHYEKALRVREHSPGTPPARIGAVLNNIASVRRKMGDLEVALRSVDPRAIFWNPWVDTRWPVLMGLGD